MCGCVCDRKCVFVCGTVRQRDSVCEVDSIPYTAYYGVKKESIKTRLVVVTQLAERSLPTPEIRGSNPDIGN